jgi:hypothetical protein
MRTRSFNNTLRAYVEEMTALNDSLAQFLTDLNNRYGINNMLPDSSLKIINYFILTQLYHALLAAIAELEALLQQESPAASIIALELLQGEIPIPAEVVKLGAGHLALPVYNVPLAIHTLSEGLQQNLRKLTAKDLTFIF